MKKPHLLRRYALLAVGLWIMAFGVAFSIKAGLGTSPISSLPYVVSLISPLTVGTATIAMHCVLILLQILLLRKNFHPIQFMQLPVAFLFGYLTDFAVWAIQGIPVGFYGQRWLLCIVGILLVGIGVGCEVIADVVTLAGEGLILAVCSVFHFPFPRIKISFDCTLVACACVLSFLFLHRLEGVREGTAAAAICVGIVSKQAIRLFLRRIEKKILME
ncbi:YitT family protein [Anaerotignum lactatifermentans]|uniref:YitT family protein n=1 Tax=Anaerotignum lactatifermentans TaxID=160404 RepID=A0ABS2G692_9FIRM|nr:DUF6198 family protein [Anaerotignum lactatifermentans]MBM6828856.1 YitT family protein [Anaerotignum lactatifermentans]MBM6876971.1 YitT family protein [Anaerotignum lactatifermentans]MBM6950529.1 YitT family protein [Anaerotignum lactatifermentans]